MALFFMVFSPGRNRRPGRPFDVRRYRPNRTGERRTFLTEPQIRLDLYWPH
jgi:hypothetical protein